MPSVSCYKPHKRFTHAQVNADEILEAGLEPATWRRSLLLFP